jgi:hypothetical protein
MIQDVAQQLIGQFAGNLRVQLAASQPAAGGTTSKPQPQQAISGFRLILAVLASALRRLFGGKP